MTNLINIILAIILFVVIIIWSGFDLYVRFNPTPWGCQIVGFGGISHVPANCIKYYINK